MPYTFGDAEVPIEDVDYLVQVDTPLLSPTVSTPSENAMVIGQRIAAHIGDGSTLQMGIGDIPNAVLASMLERKELHIWTEMFSDGVLKLSQAGALDMHVHLTASFVFGSQELYEWLNLNSQVRMMRTEVTNNSGRIAQRPQMMSINAALQVDLYDQANASRVAGKIYSGFGGSTDFIVGAINSHRGLAFMALSSWHEKSGTSTIVPLLDQPVTSFQHSYVVTEQGEAHCAGASQSRQAFNLIEKAAHPNAREALREAAGRMGLR
jgi:acyl-CoA hydrolase